MAQNPQVQVILYNPRGTANRICNNRNVGNFLAETWARYFAKYIPMQEGILASNYTTEPFQVIYESPYAHYIWEGELYLTEDARSFAEAGETKVPTGIPLSYSLEQNPLAQAHWEEPAYEAFSNTVARQVSAYLRRM